MAEDAGHRRSLPIGYYTAAQVPILGALAQNYTLFDNYFCSLQAGTYPNRMYQLCAATDIDVTGLFPGPDQPRPSNLQLAIFDRVLGAGQTAGYYSWGEPMTGLFASKRYDSISFPKDQFFTDAAAGRLPNVTFIEPNYTLVPELTGTLERRSSPRQHPEWRRVDRRRLQRAARQPAVGSDGVRPQLRRARRVL